MRTTMTVSGAVVLLKTTYGENTEPRVRRINKDEYVHIETGEIRRFENHGKSRADNKHSLYRTFQQLKDVINANADLPPGSISFLTFTYREDMTDTEQLTKDFKRFWRRYKAYHEKNGYPVPEYIQVCEIQPKRDVWHIHGLFFYPPKKRPFIEAEEIEKMWGQGFIKIKGVDDCDDLGCYLIPYLTDVLVDEELEGCPTVTVDGKTKRRIKGQKIELYPLSMKIWRASRGIKRSEKVVLTNEAAGAVRASLKDKKTYEKEEDYKDQETGFETRIKKEFYNIKRKN